MTARFPAFGAAASGAGVLASFCLRSEVDSVAALDSRGELMPKILAALAAIATVLAPAASLAEEPQAPVAPTLTPAAAVAEQYTRPHDLIDIGEGRRLNLYCAGKGGPTVVFDSGLSDWSSIWALVQPAVARRARACTYDRAGMGYSDPAKRPSSPIAIVEDLHALLHAAGVRTPIILVGHSLGGFNMKLYAALYPKDVAGLVLVDPSEERMFARAGDLATARFGAAAVARVALRGRMEMAEAVKSYAGCAEAARIHDLDPTSDLYKKCTDPVRSPLGPEIATDRQKIQVNLSYQAAQASEVANSVYGDQQDDSVYEKLFSGRHPLKKLPLIVLSHSIVPPNDLDAKIGYFEWIAVHKQTARLSARGVHRVVPGTHHNIEIDRPQAIVVAIEEVLAEAKAR